MRCFGYLLLLATILVGSLTGRAADTITSPSSATGSPGVAFFYQITATGSPSSYGATGLPAWLSVNPATGLLSGTPTAAGTWSVTISANTASGTASAMLAIQIVATSSQRVFTFGGDYVTANQNGARPASVTDGDFGTLGGTDTAFDRKALLPFDDATSLAPASGYTGPAFYGAAQRIDYNYASAPSWTSLTARRVSNVAPNDAAFLNIGGAASGFTTPPGGTTVAVLLYFQKSAFSGSAATAPLSLRSGDAGLALALGTTASSTASSVFTDSNGGNNARWMIRLDSQMYLSSATLNIASGSTSFTASTLSGSAALAMTWAPYDPATSIYFDPATATFSTLAALENVTAFGVYAGTSYVPGAGPSTSHGPQSLFALATASADLTVGPAGLPPTITSPVAALATVGQAFSYQIVASDSPTTFGAAGLPAGLVIDSSTGLISGTPTTPGTTTVLLSATNAFGTGEEELTLTVEAASAGLGVMPEYGAQSVGQANYPVPVGAYFVATDGSDSRTAEEAQNVATPWATLSKAVNSAPSGSTIVLRGGKYRQSAAISNKQDLTIQPYPREAAWFVGTDVIDSVAGWSAVDADVWVYNNYTPQFSDYLEPSTSGPGRAVDPDFPLAGHWDMVFVDGTQLYQVGSIAEVNGPGKFYADNANDKLYLWGNPAGKTVEIASSTRRRALTILSGDAQSGCTVRGIGIRGYSAGTTPLVAPLVSQAARTTFENIVVRDCAAIGIALLGDGSTNSMDSRLVHCSLIGNGQMGFSSNVCNGATFERNLSLGNNVADFSPNVQAGGGKITAGRGQRILANKFIDNQGTGLWFDVSCVGNLVARNISVGNALHGIHYEVSAGFVIAENYVADNQGGGIYVNEASGGQVWNNTLARNAINLRTIDGSRDFAQDPTGPRDSRYSIADAMAAGISWDTLDNTMKNNVLIDGTGVDNFYKPTGAMAVVQDLFNQSWRTKRSGWEMRAALDYNGYYRSAGQPPRVASWPASATVIIDSTTLAAFRSATAAAAPAGETGEEIHGVEQAGGPSPLVDEAAGKIYAREDSSFSGAGALPPANVSSALGLTGVPVLDLGINTFVAEAETTLAGASAPATTLVSFGIFSGGLAVASAPTASGATVDFLVAIPEARQYYVRLGIGQRPDGGIYQLSVSDNGSSVDVGAAIDDYASTAAGQEISLGTYEWSSGGPQTFSLRNTGKNGASSGYALTIDYIKLIPVSVAPVLPAPVITSPSTASGITGAEFSYSISAANGPTSYNATDLPAGLAVDTVTGVISGTPTAAGTFTVTLSASNATGTGTATLTLTIASSTSVHVFDFGGDYVTANASDGGGGATASDGDFGSLGGTDTAFDRRAILAFDDSRPLTPASGYAGPAFYGAAQRIDYNYAAPPAWTTQLIRRVSNVGTTDALFLNVGGAASGFTTPPGGTTAAALLYFNQTDFLGGGATGILSLQSTDVGFSIGIGTTASSAAASVFTDANAGNNARWMIRLGTQMYLSSATLNIPFGASTFTTHALSGSAALAMTWAPYDPATSIYFDPATAVFATLPALDNVTAFGVYAGVVYAPGSGPAANHGPQSHFAVAVASADLSVRAAPPAISAPLTASGTVGSAFFAQIVASNLPTEYTASGLPAGLAVDTVTGLISGTPAAAGSYSVTLSATNEVGTGTASLALTVAPAPATVTLGNLTATYDGQPYAASATTDPTGLSVTITYDGNATPPTDAGSYSVQATVADPNYSGSTRGTLIISQATQTIAFPNPGAKTYGDPPFALGATASSGLPVNYTVVSGQLVVSDGIATITGSGVATISASQSGNANYQPAPTVEVTVTIAKASAAIALSDLVQNYDGTPKSVTVTTTPTGLSVSVTYDGSATPPIYPGSYAVVATITDPNYSGSTSGTLEIGITALIRHAPTLNGDLDCSIQVLTAESVTLNGSAGVYGDLLLPGTPALKLNGNPAFGSTIDGPGATTPTNHTVTLNGGALLQHLVRHIDAIAMPVVAAPSAPAGMRSVTINSASQSIGDPATLRNLTVNSGGGTVALPPGTYGNITLNSGTTLVLGTADSAAPSVYQLQQFTLNGNSQVVLAGPVEIVVANSVNLNGSLNPTHTAACVLKISSGGLTLNSGTLAYARVVAPSGTVTLNGSGGLHGSVAADRLVINGGSLLED